LARLPLTLIAEIPRSCGYVPLILNLPLVPDSVLPRYAVRDCLKRVGHGATAPEWESRRQPGCGWNRLTPGLLGRCPVDQGTPHAVGPTRIIFSDSLW